jgi:hypothetical protein
VDYWDALSGSASSLAPTFGARRAFYISID